MFAAIYRDQDVDAASGTLLRWLKRERLYVTAISARCALGKAVSRSARLEIEVWRQQLEQRRQFLSFLANVAPGVQQLKGFAVGDRYPKGWLRSSVDVDLLASNEAELWRIALACTETGWLPLGLVLWTHCARPALLLTLVRREAGKTLLSLDVSTAIAFGHETNPRVIGVHELPKGCHKLFAQCVAILDEQFQRPVRLRDAWDLGLLLHEMGPAEAAIFFEFAALNGLGRGLARAMYGLRTVRAGGAAGELAKCFDEVSEYWRCSAVASGTCITRRTSYNARPNGVVVATAAHYSAANTHTFQTPIGAFQII